MRVTLAVASRKRRKRVLRRARGYYGASSKRIRTSYNAVDKAQAYSFIGRKQKKRQYRGLWTIRITAACEALGMRYSKFMNLLKIMNIGLNRKMLAEIAVRDNDMFKKFVDLAKVAVTKDSINNQ